MAHLDFDIDQHYTVGERQFILYEYFQKYAESGHADLCRRCAAVLGE